jgi:hypothetical protein
VRALREQNKVRNEVGLADRSGGQMKHLTRRARAVVASSAVMLAATGAAGALVLSGTSASASSAPRVHSSEPLLSLCITIKPISPKTYCIVI